MWSRRDLLNYMKDKKSEMTAWWRIKVIPTPDHTGMPFALLHSPHTHFFFESATSAHLYDLPTFPSHFTSTIGCSTAAFQSPLPSSLLSPLLNLASRWSFMQGFSEQQRSLNELIGHFHKNRDNKRKRKGQRDVWRSDRHNRSTVYHCMETQLMSMNSK